jgi:hypothetical protein
MSSLAEAGLRRRKNTVAFRSQRIRHWTPAPAPMPSSVDKHKSPAVARGLRSHLPRRKSEWHSRAREQYRSAIHDPLLDINSCSARRSITGPQAYLYLGIKTFLNGALVSDIVLDTSSCAPELWSGAQSEAD